jgi:hypothetical protein
MNHQAATSCYLCQFINAACSYRAMRALQKEGTSAMPRSFRRVKFKHPVSVTTVPSVCSGYTLKHKEFRATTAKRKMTKSISQKGRCPALVRSGRLLYIYIYMCVCVWEALLLQPSFYVECSYSHTKGSISTSHFCVQVLNLRKIQGKLGQPFDFEGRSNIIRFSVNKWTRQFA